MQELTKTINAVKGVSVLVVGDLMLDRFVYGDVDRISPESPVPVLSITHEDEMLGGAGNVVSNLCALGVKSAVFAVVGNDANADRIIEIAKSYGADTGGIVKDPSRPTTLKTRYLARHQHLLRSDSEKTFVCAAAIEKKIADGVAKAIKSAKAVILSDYGKGVLSQGLIIKVIELANAQKIPVLVDPKGKDYMRYKGADVVTPNRKELAEASGFTNLKEDADIVHAAEKIIQSCDIKCVVATRSEDGMSVIGNGAPQHLKTQVREVFDVSGAGDTVIATLAAVLATGADIVTAAKIANIAGGIAVSKVGTTPVRTEEILESLAEYSPHLALVADGEKALEQIRKWHAKGLKVGLTNGCFDILHKGHVTYLAQARGLCDRLIVALNHDVSVKILKGPSRPVNDQDARAAVIGALSSVDMVVFFGAEKAGADNTPCALIEKLKPDIYFKGGDYKLSDLPEAKIVQAYGGEVAIMGLQEGYSTTAIIEKSKTPSR